MKVRTAGRDTVFINPAMILQVRIIFARRRLFQPATEAGKVEVVLIDTVKSNGNGYGIAIMEDEFFRILPELQKLEWWEKE